MSAKISNALFKGDSGEQYRFEIFQLQTVFAEGVGGIYAYAKRYKLPDGNFTIDPIYIGEIDDFLTVVGYHPKQKCMEQYGYNCKCIYKVYDDKRREYVCQDLLDYYEPPCND